MLVWHSSYFVTNSAQKKKKQKNKNKKKQKKTKKKGKKKNEEKERKKEEEKSYAHSIFTSLVFEISMVCQRYYSLIIKGHFGLRDLFFF